MKAIILAAGKGTRLEPITLETPKAMVEVYGKPLLAHNMDKLLPYVNEFIIVVKYKQEKIREYFGESYKGIKISYHQQGEKKGTGAAVQGINISGDIVIAYADAIFRQSDIDAVMKCKDYAVLAKKVDNPEKYGIFELNSEGYIQQVVEKPEKYIGNLANFSFFKVNHTLLEYTEQIQESLRGEIEITDALNLFVQKENMKPIILENDFLDITSVEDLEKANSLKKPQLGETRYIENIGKYEVHLGVPQSGIQEIVDYTLDESDIALKKGTGDWKKRFISVENFTTWYNDTNRYPFTLLDTNGAVVGIWWGRPAKVPDITEIIDTQEYEKLQENLDNIHTSGIRIYKNARGKGLASPFLDVCSRCYHLLFPNFCMSIDIDADNIPSQKAFEKIGFKKIAYGQNVNNSREAGKEIGNERYIYVQHYNS